MDGSPAKHAFLSAVVTLSGVMCNFELICMYLRVYSKKLSCVMKRICFICMFESE